MWFGEVKHLAFHVTKLCRLIKLLFRRAVFRRGKKWLFGGSEFFSTVSSSKLIHERADAAGNSIAVLGCFRVT